MIFFRITRDGAVGWQIPLDRVSWCADRRSSHRTCSSMLRLVSSLHFLLSYALNADKWCNTWRWPLVKINFNSLMTMAGRIFIFQEIQPQRNSAHRGSISTAIVRGFFPTRSDVVRPSFQLTWNPENRRCDSFSVFSRGLETAQREQSNLFWVF